MKEIIEELTSINNELFCKFGSESYELRCRIYDVKEELKKYIDDKNLCNKNREAKE